MASFKRICSRPFVISTPLEMSCLSNTLFAKILLVINEQTTIGKVAAIAYSYEPVSSKTNIIAVIGAPITELETAAIPETARTESKSGLIEFKGNGFYKVWSVPDVKFLPARAPTTTQSGQMDMWCFTMLMSVLGSVAYIEKVKDGEDFPLNRRQTNEWKGWMQVAFVMYHYAHAEPIFAPIRVFVSAYVWMTNIQIITF